MTSDPKRIDKLYLDPSRWLNIYKPVFWVFFIFVCLVKKKKQCVQKLPSLRVPDRQ